MVMVLILCLNKYMQVLGCLFVIQSGRFLIVLLGDVILDSDWLLTTIRESWQQYGIIRHSLTMYKDRV